MPCHVGTLKVVITMSQLRWTEFSLTICRGAKRQLRRKSEDEEDGWGEAKFTGSVCRERRPYKGLEAESTEAVVF